MRLAIGLFVAGVVGATAAFRGAGPAAPAAPRTVERVADLPPGIVAALGVTLAGPGMPYRVRDAGPPGDARPVARLIWAQRDGTAWRVHYEQGGPGHFYGLATLRPVATGWTVTTERGARPLPQRNTP